MASKIAIIIEREYKTRVMKKSFILMTLLTPIFFLLISTLPTVLMTMGGNDTQKIGLMDETGLYGEVLQSTDDFQFIVADKSWQEYQKLPEDERPISALLVIRQDLREDPKALTMMSFATLPPNLEDYINTKLSDFVTRQKLLSHNVEGIEEMIAESQTRIVVPTYKVGKDGAETLSSGVFAMGLGIFLALASYMFISIWGGSVLQSVMEEKKSRIMEVMVSSVRPFELMMGKIIGVGLVGLTQIFIWTLVLTLCVQGGMVMLGDVLAGNETMLPAATTAEDKAMVASIVSTLSSVNFFEIIVCFVLFFIGGFLLYASVYAAFGSAISSDEEAQSIMWPLTILMMLAFYTGLACVQSPDSTLAHIASYIPFTAPVVMMIRIPYGVSIWEEVLSLLALYGGFTLIVYLGAKIYRVGVLMYGKRPTLKEIIRWTRQS